MHELKVSWMSWLSLASLVVATSACVVVDGGGNTAEGEEEAAEGEDEAAEGEGEGEAAEGEGEGEAAEGEGEGEAPEFDWAGTWTIAANYNVTCDAAGSLRTSDNSGTWAMSITGDNSALEGQTSGFYYVQGSGSATRLLLSGAFPLKGTDNQDAVTMGAAISFTVTASDENNAAGTLSGTYRSGFGLDCTINTATVTFAR